MEWKKLLAYVTGTVDDELLLGRRRWEREVVDRPLVTVDQSAERGPIPTFELLDQRILCIPVHNYGRTLRRLVKWLVRMSSLSPRPE